MKTRKLLKVTLCFISSILSIILLLFLLLNTFVKAENTIIDKNTSPNGQYFAYVFERNAGATNDYSTQISIYQKNKKFPNKPGNVFICDGNHGKVTNTNIVGGPYITIKWINDEVVEVNIPINTRIFKQELKIDNINIAYITKN